MTRIWRYVLAADNGMAPCVQNGLLSLACCKPTIRRHAEPGDWVIGFLPKRKDRDRVRLVWAGQIAENPTLGDYELRFPERSDAIYRRVGYSEEGTELLLPLAANYHDSERHHVRDRRGQNALLFRRYWYWGDAAIGAPPEIAEMVHYFVGQSSKGSTPARVRVLEEWLTTTVPPGRHGNPRDALRTDWTGIESHVSA